MTKIRLPKSKMATLRRLRALHADYDKFLSTVQATPSPGEGWVRSDEAFLNMLQIRSELVSAIAFLEQEGRARAAGSL